MRLEKGQSVHIGRKKFTGEIPDEIAKKHGLLKKTDKKKPAPVEAPKKD